MSFALFQFEIKILNISNLIKCNEFFIRSEFADVFSLYLTPPKLKSNTDQQKVKYKNKINCLNTEHIPKCDTVEFISTKERLSEKMKTHPLVLAILTKKNNKIETGMLEISWNYNFFDFLDGKLPTMSQKITDKCKYHIYNNDRSKRLAVIHLQIKLSYCNDHYDCKSVYSNVSTYLGKQENINHGTIRTTYRGKTIKETINDLDKGDKQENPSDTTKNNGSLSDLASIKKLQDEVYNYFINDKAVFPEQVYCVGYCTVEKDKSPPSAKTSNSSNITSSEPTSENDMTMKKYKLNLCDDDCRGAGGSLCSMDLPEKARSLIVVKECNDINCVTKEKDIESPASSNILIDLHNIDSECCKEAIEVDEINVDMKANVKFLEHTCDCACECTIGFRKTTYCTVCKGYEVKGSDLAGQLIHELPHPCPMYHNLMDKFKSKSLILSTSGSGSRKTIKSGRSNRSIGRLATGSREIVISKSDIMNKRPKDADKKSVKSFKSVGEGSKKSFEMETDKQLTKKIDKNAKFKFKYGYQGIPHNIGKDEVKPAGVPKNMGWLWNAEDIPGMKFRPNWKPGATHKHVVKLLKIARNPNIIMSKKKKKRDTTKKKNVKRPLLTVHKKEGEYHVTMETVKLQQKPRVLNQFPYEDKPPCVFTIGRTDEENYRRQQKRERAQRNLDREKRQFIESSFKNVCKEICLRTYQQALGILPGTEDPDCPCFPTIEDIEQNDTERECVCSDDESVDSETDSDEWIVNFTPPNAKYDPNFKVRRINKTDNGTQYSYLDYKVKLLDRLGYPVPRFFKGPDGKEQCSDLGGFWGPNNKWLEINADGYIAPDGRWAPNTFIGPDGDQMDTDTGKFQCADGTWLLVGVDGYINSDGKWQYYRRGARKESKTLVKKNIGAGDMKGKHLTKQASPIRLKKKEKVPTEKKSMWSCFADNISPKYLSEMGIVGHGQDRVLLKKSLTEMAARGENVKIPQPSTVPRTIRTGRATLKPSQKSHNYFEEKYKCKHSVPPAKGIVAVDEDGNKVYFRLRSRRNKRKEERFHALKDKGISLSTFHVPCLSSFINGEVMKQQLREKLINLAEKLELKSMFTVP